MNAAIEDKNAYEELTTLIEEVRDDIKTVGTRSTWLLGLLIVIILALASFIFRSYGALPLEIKTNEIFLLLREASQGLCYIYLALLFIYIRPLIVPIFEKPNYELKDIEELREKLQWNVLRLEKLTRQFKTLASLFMASVPASLFLAWVI